MPDALPRAARWRARRRAAAILLLLAVHVPLHGLWRAFGWRSPWPMRFLGQAGRAAGVDTRIVGTPLRRDVLIVANHLSWVDILVLAGATGARFVAKDEIAASSVLGFLAGLNRTIYVARGQRRDVRAQAGQLRAALGEGQPVVLFPEGSTGDGASLLPFHASLFSAIEPPPSGLLLQPVAIDYGADARTIAWGNTETGAEMMRVLALPGRRRATLRFLDPIVPAGSGDRKAMAEAARRGIAEALGWG